MRHQDRYADAAAYGDPYEPRDDVAPWDDPWDASDPGHDVVDPPTRAHRTVRAPRYDEYDAYDDEVGLDEPVPALPPARARARDKSRHRAATHRAMAAAHHA